MNGITRTQEEIITQIDEIAKDDTFGFQTDVLISALDFENAQSLLVSEITADKWATVRIHDCVSAAQDYLVFAINKIVNHRGLSAIRSVDTLSTYAWLLGRDDVVSAMADAEYTNYGAPKIKVFAQLMGWPWPGDVTETKQMQLERMANGMSCTDHCSMGCAE